AHSGDAVARTSAATDRARAITSLETCSTAPMVPWPGSGGSGMVAAPLPLEPGRHARAPWVGAGVQQPGLRIAPRLLDRAHVEVIRRKRLELGAEPHQIAQNPGAYPARESDGAALSLRPHARPIA